MQVDLAKLRERINLNGISIQDFSKEIGMNPSTFYRKMNSDGVRFTVGQMHKTVEVLSLTNNEAVQIFLAGNSH